MRNTLLLGNIQIPPISNKVARKHRTILNIGERSRSSRSRLRVNEDDDNFKFECSSECQDRVHLLAECLFDAKERKMYVIELGQNRREYCTERQLGVKIGRRNTVATGAGSNRREVISTVRKTLLSHLW